MDRFTCTGARAAAGLALLWLAATLAGCSATPDRLAVDSPCVRQGEAAFACQIERYQNVNGD